MRTRKAATTQHKLAKRCNSNAKQKVLHNIKMKYLWRVRECIGDRHTAHNTRDAEALCKCFAFISTSRCNVNIWSCDNDRFIKHAYDEHISHARVRPQNNEQMSHTERAHLKSFVGFNLLLLMHGDVSPVSICVLIYFVSTEHYVHFSLRKRNVFQSPSVAVAWHGAKENKRISFAGNKNEGNYTVFLLIPLTWNENAFFFFASGQINRFFFSSLLFIHVR